MSSPGTRFDGPGDSPGFLLWHATLRWQRTMAAALGPLELTHVQFVLLACTSWLSAHGRRTRQVDIAQLAGTDVRMTSQVLRRLEAAGLLQRHVDDADSRAQVVTVTPRGREVAAEAFRRVEDADEAFFAAYPAAFVEALRAGPGT